MTDLNKTTGSEKPAGSETSSNFVSRVPAPTTRLQIVNPDERYRKADLIAPTTHGYIYIAAAVQPGSLPFVLPSTERSRLVARLTELARGLEQADTVVKASVFHAIVMPPTAKFSTYLQERAPRARIASFDVFILIETTSPIAARELQETSRYQSLFQALRGNAKAVHVMVARNVRRIADVDTPRDGLFLFNHFVAEDREVLLELWDYLAGWYAVETGLRNSVALSPLEGEARDYPIVNFAGWDVSPLRHFWHQLSKKSFWRYVIPNLEANHAASMPVYCRLA